MIWTILRYFIGKRELEKLTTPCTIRIASPVMQKQCVEVEVSVFFVVDNTIFQVSL